MSKVDMIKVCAVLGFDPTNHHNAAKCPYCNMSYHEKFKLAEKLKRRFRDALIEAIDCLPDEGVPDKIFNRWHDLIMRYGDNIE